MFSLLGVQQGRSDPGSLVSGLRSSEMLGSDHTHSIDGTCHRAQSLGMASVCVGQRGCRRVTEAQLADRFKSWLGRNKVGSYSLRASGRDACMGGLSLRGWGCGSVWSLPSYAWPWLHFIIVEKRKENNLSQKDL